MDSKIKTLTPKQIKALAERERAKADKAISDKKIIVKRD